MKPVNRKKISGILASAVCALLGSEATEAEGLGWKVDTAYLLYSEKDRVEANEPTVKLQKTFVDDSKLNFNFVFDTLSGPSPTGAAPSNVAQTFTGPSSSSGGVSVPAGKIPFDSNFEDTRTQFGTSWDAPIDRLSRYNIGFNTSKEHDYSSIGVSAGFSRDFNKKNTTVATGISYAHDQVKPEGGAPIPATPMLAGNPYNTTTGASGSTGQNTGNYNTVTGTSGTGQTTGGDDDDDRENGSDDNYNTLTGASGSTGQTSGTGNNESPEDFNADGKNIQAKNKDVIDFVLGLTQVINARTLMQFNLGLNRASGYLNDPYKVVSIVNAETGVPINVELGGIIYESRPDTRLKTSLFWNTRYHLERGDTVNFSYRYMFDDWGINSHTIDLSYRWNMTDQWYLEPHTRLYTQTEADFYHQSLSDNQPIPKNISADSRLSAFNATTLGAKIGYKITPHSEFNIRFENYEQKGKKSNNPVGIQAQYDTFPALSATITQIGYSFEF